MTAIADPQPALNADIPEEKTPLGAWWVAVLLMVLCALSAADKAIIAMLVEPIQRDLHLTDFQMSLILGPAYAFAYALAAIPLAWLADRGRRRWVIAGGVVFWSASTLASALARSFGGLFLCRVGVGAGESALSPAAYGLIAEKFPRRRLTTGMAIYGMGPKLGASAAFGVAALFFAQASPDGLMVLPLIGETQAWHAVFICMGAVGIVLAPLCFTFSEIGRPSATASQPKDAASLLPFIRRWPTPILPLYFGFGLMALTANALASWTPAYMEREYGWGPAQYGPTMAVITLITAGSVIFKGLIVDWLYGRGMKDAHVRFYTWLQLICIPATVAAFTVKSPWAFLYLYALMNIAVLSFIMYQAAVLQLVTPKAVRGQVTAGALLLVMLAAGAAPPLVAAVTDFVFQDRAKLALSLPIVCVAAQVISVSLLRFALPGVRRAIAHNEAADVAAASAT